MKIVLDYGNDSKETIKNKEILFELYNMKILKKNNLWWDDNEKVFKKKYNIESDHEKVDKIYDYLKKNLLK